MNQLQKHTTESPRIVSGFGVRGDSSQFARLTRVNTFFLHSISPISSVDECDRLWVVDSGMTDLLGQPTKMQSPSVLVFDLHTNELVRRFEIPTSQIKADSFFVNIVS